MKIVDTLHMPPLLNTFILAKSRSGESGCLWLGIVIVGGWGVGSYQASEGDKRGRREGCSETMLLSPPVPSWLGRAGLGDTRGAAELDGTSGPGFLVSSQLNSDRSVKRRRLHLKYFRLSYSSVP